MERMLYSEEVADRLRVTPTTLRIWRHRGQGPASYKYGRRVVYREADIEAWLATCVIPGETGPAA